MTGGPREAEHGPGSSEGSGSSATGGEAFGPYRLVELLGRGGMGEVWRAYDTRRQRTVALKRLTSAWADVPSFRQRFEREALATARLESEHVVVIHDFGEIDGRLFIDMRLVSGGDLAGFLGAHPYGLGVTTAVDLCAQIANGLDGAHRAGLVHRDVKPSNVLLARDIRGHRAYLVDFGIAKLADELTGSGLTATGSTVGTVAYMAPELYEGAASVASDVYALGCVLFEMLTGRRVFEATTAMAYMTQHLHRPPPPPSSVRPELAPFDAVLARALAKDPSRRQPSAGALAAEALQTHARSSPPGPPPGSHGVPPGAPPGVPWYGGPPGAPPGGLPPTVATSLGGTPSRPWWRRHWAVLVAVVAVVAIAAGTAVGVVATHSSTPSSAPSSAQPPAAATPSPPPVAVPVSPGVPQQVPVTMTAGNGVVFAPDGRRAYFASGDNSFVVVDTASGASIATVSIPAAGGYPNGVALSPDARHAYVSSTGNDQEPGSTISVVDTSTYTVVATIPFGVEPIGLAPTPDGRHLYVSAFGTGVAPGTVVGVIDTATNAVTATIPVGQAPGRLSISPDGSKVYVPNEGTSTTAGSTVTVIDTATNTTRNLPSGDFAPVMTVPSPDGRKVYVICAGATNTPGSIQVLDTVSNTVTRLGDPTAVNVPTTAALTPDGRTLIVANRGDDAAVDHTLSVIDTVTGVTKRTTAVTGRPYSVAVAPDGRTAWTSTTEPATVWRIPLNAG